MLEKKIVAGIDIGTTKVCTIIAEINNEQITDIIGVGITPSKGLRKGMVIDIDNTINSIQSSIIKAERMAGVNIESVFIGIAGSHISSTNSHGVVTITGEDKEISKEDIGRVIEATKIISISPEREIIHALPRGFVVDGCEEIEDPLGMSGVRLEAETHIITGSTIAIENLAKCVTRTEVDVEGIVLQPLAASKAVLSESEKELGVVLIDMGGGTTDIAIFKGGRICYTSTLAVGGDHVTSDITVGMRTPISNAEMIKIQHGCASADLVDDKEELEILDASGQTKRTVSLKMLSQIIEPRIDELFNLVEEEIKQAGYENSLPAGMVITGGGSLLSELPVLASKKLNMSVRIGVPVETDVLFDYLDYSIYGSREDYADFSKDNGAVFSTAIGLLYYGVENFDDKKSAKQKRREESVEDLVKKARSWFDDFSNKLRNHIALK